jgi:hypothetical protein
LLNGSLTSPSRNTDKETYPISETVNTVHLFVLPKIFIFSVGLQEPLSQ